MGSSVLQASISSNTTGAEAIADIIAQHGVKTVFALAGASHTLLLKALAERGIKIVGSRHESATVAAADGYARTTGRLGVALVIEEQGLPNAVGGLASSWSARSSVLVIAARSPHGWYDAEFEFDLDTQAFVKPVTKWARAIPSPERIPEYMDAAIRQATGTPPGPVVLTVSRDYFAARLDAVSWAPAQAPAIQAGTPDGASVKEIAERLLKAKRPLIVLGASAGREDAAYALRALQAKCPVPIMAQSSARGLLGEDNATVFNWAYAYPAAKEADVVVFLGGPISQRLGFGQDARFSADACYVRVEPSADELHRFRWVDFPIQSCIVPFVLALTRALTDETLKAAFHSQWVAVALQPRSQAIAALPRLGPTLHPIEIGDALKALPFQQGTIVGDGAAIQSWFNLGFKVPAGFRFMDHFPLGSMGVGTALAVGAAAAEAEKNQDGITVLVTGDGSFGYYMAELSEAVRAGLRLVVIVGNDGAWGTELHGQLMKQGKAFNTELGPQDFAVIANGLGCAGQRVSTRVELDNALKRAWASNVPYVIDAQIDRNAGKALKIDETFSNALFDSVLPHSHKKLVTQTSA